MLKNGRRVTKKSDLETGHPFVAFLLKRVGNGALHRHAAAFINKRLKGPCQLLAGQLNMVLVYGWTRMSFYA